MSDVIDLVLGFDGLTHEDYDGNFAMCGRGYFTDAVPAGAFKEDIVTCLACLYPPVTKDCGHVGALVGNCPYTAEIDGNREQRCRCCETCADRCGDAI